MNISGNYLHLHTRQGPEVTSPVFSLSMCLAVDVKPARVKDLLKLRCSSLLTFFLNATICNGTRFKKEIREISYRGKNLIDVLDMTVDQAVNFFAGNDKITKGIELLSEVGLGYLKLGQPSNTLSGGEAQRIKLAANLSAQRERKHTLFIFDEPTTGLHFHDISKLINCFNLLLERNNSVVIIEHNLEIIKCADYIIDMGPEAGDKGGEIVITGTPEIVARNPNSWTGRYLKEYLD